jgi:phosphate-selective porin O/P
VHWMRLKRLNWLLALGLGLVLVGPPTLAAAELEALRQKVEVLEAELAQARAALDEELKQTEQERLQRQAESRGMVFGPVSIGGAMRVNYVYGDYDNTDDGPSRGGQGGNVELDTFRINASLDAGPWIGKFEYRWYPAGSGKSYNFLHTLWLGYEFDEQSHLEVGQNRVPFGAGPYGVSQSWFFDQHYYVGLADDPDLGAKYSRAGERWSWDLAYYWRSEPSFSGRSEDSARYGYDAVRWRETIDVDGNVDYDVARSGYREKDQGNLRLVRHLGGENWESDLGASLQYGSLAGSGVSDGDQWAASIHAVNRIDNWTLGLQLSRYRIDIDGDNPWNTDDLVPFGAYDFAWPVATDSWLPAVSLAYRVDTPAVPWLDYVLPYLEYSSIIKSADGLEDSEMAVLGAAWASGGWYIYSDLAYSNGNYFVGDKGDDYSRVDGVGDFGVAGNTRWHYRFNLNLGYYY